MPILVTGAAGYIGSHAAQRLLRDGHSVLAIDNLSRGHVQAIDRLRSSPFGDRLHFVPADASDHTLLSRLILDFKIDSVMHFAALAYVGESVQQPLLYYANNVSSTLGLLQAIDAAALIGQTVRRFVFSSTCATYGEPSDQFIPIPETCPQHPINPYGYSKLHCEHILADYAHAATKQGREFAFAALRYFNVAGSDRSSLLGEHHNPETHLIPVALQTALKIRANFGFPSDSPPPLSIFGTDYPTPDGTCIRDYVHVEDLVDAHATVLQALQPGDQRRYNLGIGIGYSVRQILDSVRRVTRLELPSVESARRPGDPPRLFADPRKIQSELGWKAGITDLDEIVDSAFRWYKANPRGYHNC